MRRTLARENFTSGRRRHAISLSMLKVPNVRMRVASTFSCMVIMRVTGLAITMPFGISKTESDLK